MRILTVGAFACVAAAAACSSTSPAEAPFDGGVANLLDASQNIEDAARSNIEDAARNIEDAAQHVVEAGPPAPTFTAVYGDIISPICVQCHNPSGIGVSEGHLDMSSKAAAFSNLVNVGAMGIACGGMGTRVIPNNAADSILYKKIDPDQGSPCGSKMPLGLTPLTEAQADEIENWINAGALND